MSLQQWLFSHILRAANCCVLDSCHATLNGLLIQNVAWTMCCSVNTLIVVVVFVCSYLHAYLCYLSLLPFLHSQFIHQLNMSMSFFWDWKGSVCLFFPLGCYMMRFCIACRNIVRHGFSWSNQGNKTDDEKKYGTPWVVGWLVSCCSPMILDTFFCTYYIATIDVSDARWPSPQDASNCQWQET